MRYTRREFGKLALATAPAIALLDRTVIGAALAQARPNSLINGVQVGTITYSFRSMPDQSAEATLKYVVDSGINAIELMGAPVERYLGLSEPRGGGRAGGGAPGRGGRGAPDPATLTASWNGVACAPAQPNADNLAAAGLAAAARGGGGRGAGRGGRGTQTPEQRAAAEAAAADRRKRLLAVSMDKVKALRAMYNDAGVSIYAVKMLNTSMSDDEVDGIFNIASALGCTHTTLELTEDEAQLKRLGDFALRHKVYVAYHTHTQGSMTIFDKAFALSEGNRANVDLGHFVAGGGDALAFLNKFHAKIASFHLKDRTTPAHCALNLAWGTGETPITQILQTVQKNRWTMPATIELEYAIPEGSDAVKEVQKCVAYCRRALA
ncbi:MAG TPA: TIM barrel protein [Vicinamibacterales bacterium]|jgi:sugar phosphate isomerase/epimerase|nr:TIM barrel protein [Vicinamibacterales bacterium]